MNVRNWIKHGKTVLIQGETGVGKSSFVRSIALELKLKIIQLNINNLSVELFESELFGHKKGSFSGAVSDKPGICEDVGDGILFIDEIGDLSWSAQTKLLMLLEEREFRRVGDFKVRKFAGKIVLATHHCLEKLVHLNKFREDLYFRINTFTFKIQPLRQKENKRVEINKFIGKYMSNIKLEKNLLNFLNYYDWPGNYRELKNVIDYLSLSEEKMVSIKSLPTYLKDKKTEDLTRGKTYKEEFEKFEKEMLKNALKTFNFHLTKSAQGIGISRVTMIKKVKQYNLNEYVRRNKLEYTYGF